jgi:hypothetical protein
MRGTWGTQAEMAMAVVVIGGQASGVGKTGVICALIAAMPEQRWTAIKITQCSHGGVAAQKCDCKLGGAKFALTEERDAVGRNDSSRYLAAGAVRSLWVRTLPGHLADAMRAIREVIDNAPNSILESNSVLQFLDPDVYALIVWPWAADFKPSARRYLSRADVILLATPPPGHGAPQPAWGDELQDQLAHVPQFAITRGELAPSQWLDFVRRKMNG